MKNLLNFRLIALGVAASLSFTACEKAETESAAQKSNAKDAEMNVVGSARSSAAIKGLITESTADKMRETYKSNFVGKNYTEHVTFDIADLENYLKHLRATYNSDKVHVYFGQYDKTTATSPSNEGRVTVFFLGNNKKSNSGNIRSQNLGDGTTLDGSNYLNHGNIWP